MSEHEQNKPESDFVGDDVVERAAEALRDVKTPQGPSPELLADVLSAIRAADSRNTPSNDNGIWQRIWTMKAMTRVAAAVTLIIGAAVVISLNWTGQTAFAQVLEKVQQVRSVRYTTQATLNLPNHPKPTVTEVKMVIVGNRMRQEVPGKFVSIMDFKSGEVLQLMPAQKQAVRITMANMPKNVKERNLLEVFRTMQANGGKPIRRKEIGGQMLEGYEVEQNGLTMNVYADPKTLLPVRIETTVNMPAVVSKSQAVMTDFVWDSPTDEADVSMEIPPGYQVQETTFDAAKATEKDFVDAMRTIATLNDGQFPASFDMAGLTGALAKSKGAMVANSAAGKRAEFMQTTMSATHGMMFVQESNGDDFHYAGKGVKLGEAGRPVVWYRPTNSTTYHVIDAELKVHTGVSADELPKVESVKMMPVMKIGAGAPGAK